VKFAVESCERRESSCCELSCMLFGCTGALTPVTPAVPDVYRMLHCPGGPIVTQMSPLDHSPPFPVACNPPLLITSAAWSHTLSASAPDEKRTKVAAITAVLIFSFFIIFQRLSHDARRFQRTEGELGFTTHTNFRVPTLQLQKPGHTQGSIRPTQVVSTVFGWRPSNWELGARRSAPCGASNGLNPHLSRTFKLLRASRTAPRLDRQYRAGDKRLRRSSPHQGRLTRNNEICRLCAP
jgi:hypothetical protein